VTARPSEFDLIRQFFAPLSVGAPGAFNLTDDAAVLSLGPSEELVVTTDTLVARRHFLGTEDTADIARKALRVNLSDLASMGAKPIGYTLALALPDDWTTEWLAAFADGLGRDQREFGIHLLGGDTVSSDAGLHISVTAMGATPAGQSLRRGGARIGDTIWVSGTVGDAALGLLILRDDSLGEISDEARRFLAGRFLLPTPRCTLGPALRGLATAAIDISDGIVADLGHICEVSAVGADLKADAIPRSEAYTAVITQQPSLLQKAFSAGDDYEILFTAPPENDSKVKELSQKIGLPLTPAGTITDGDSVIVTDATGQPMDLAATGYQHF